MKLINGSLEQIAEIAEETVNPVDDYRNQDWSDVRRRQASRYTFLQAKNAQPARIEIETVDEVVKYQGTMQTYTYWLETDGAWHALRKNWSERESTRIKFLGKRQEHLIWDEQRKRFVNE